MWKAEVLQLPFFYVTQPPRPEAVSETNRLPTTVNTATPAPQAAQPSAPILPFCPLPCTRPWPHLYITEFRRFEAHRSRIS